MNQVDSTVIEVLCPPKFGEDSSPELGYACWWTVAVRADCYGREHETTVLCKTEAEALAIKPGYTWLT